MTLNFGGIKEINDEILDNQVQSALQAGMAVLYRSLLLPGYYLVIYLFGIVIYFLEQQRTTTEQIPNQDIFR